MGLQLRQQDHGGLLKHCNKIGLDVALEALKGARACRKASAEDIWRNVQVCHVANVMRPCLEIIR